MPSKRDDYILRAIELLRQFVADAIALRDKGKLDQALLAVVTAQEKLFARPAPEFMGLDLDEQLRLLRIGEAPESARDKLLGYAAVLRQAGLVYAARERRDLAEAAFQSALYVTLSAVIDSKPAAETARADIAELVERVDPQNLHAPVKALLDQVQTLLEA